MTDLISQHPLIVYSEEIAAICNPLKKLNITYFSHVRKQGKDFSALGMNPGFIEHYLRNQYYNVDIHTAKESNMGDIVVWDAIDLLGKSAQMHHEAAMHGNRHTFTLREHHNGVSDYYHFATTSSSTSINQVYLSNIDLLKLFIQHFNQTISQSRQLSSAYDIKFKIKDSEESYYEFKNELILPGDVRSEFLNSLSVNKLENVSKKISPQAQSFVRPHNETVTTKLQRPSLSIEKFSKREVECIYLTVRGKSAKQISNELKISRRTVEEYLTNIKVKMGVYTKSELIDNAINLFE